MESTGYFMNKWDIKANEESQSDQRSVENLKQAETKDKLPPKAMEIFKYADNVLQSEFNFYSFAVMINAE